MESSQTKDWTRVPCTGRQILKHWTTREVWNFVIDFSFEIVQTIQNIHELGQGDKRGLTEIIGFRITKPCILLALEPHHEKQMFCESRSSFTVGEGEQTADATWPRLLCQGLLSFLSLPSWVLVSLHHQPGQPGVQPQQEGRVPWLCPRICWLRLPLPFSLLPTGWLTSWRQLQNHSQVLNLALMIFPFSSTWICDFITSPQATVLTNTVPTFLDVRGPVSRIFMWSTSMWQRELTAPSQAEAGCRAEGLCPPEAQLQPR